MLHPLALLRPALKLPILVALATLAAPAASALDVPPNWYTGDLHVHWPSSECLGVADPTTIYNAMPSDLNLAAVLLWCGGDVYEQNALDYFTGKADAAISTPDKIVHYDVELSSCNLADRMGHVSYFNLDDAMFPDATYQGPVQDWARAQGAYVGFDHAQAFAESYTSFPVLTRCCVPYEVPVDVALGRVDFLIYQPNQNGWRFLWYTLLDCGFRLGMALTTDSACMPFSMGTHRTYAFVDEALSYGKFVKSVKDGRVVLSQGNAGFIEFTVGGVAMGGELNLPLVQSSAQVEAELSLPDGVLSTGTLEVVRNQEVIASQPYSQTGGKVMISFTDTVPQSSWYVARTDEVHTGPVYAVVAGTPIRASVQSAVYYISYMDWLAAQIELGFFNQLTPDDKAALLNDITDARKAFDDIRLEAWFGPPTSSAVALPPARVHPNVPNPFNPQTSIRFDIHQAGPVDLEVVDLMGRRVRSLLQGAALSVGSHDVPWDGRDDQGLEVGSGVYLYRVTAGGFVDSGRMTLVK